MSEPIYDHLEHAWHGITRHGQRDAEGVKRVWDQLIRHNETSAPDVSDPPEGNTAMSVLTDVGTRVEDFLTRMKTEAEQVIADVVPVVHDAAAKADQLTSSKIVAEVEGLAAPLDPAFEEFVAGIIRSAGAAAARIAELTAPPPAPEAPVDPAADPASAMA